MNKKSRSMKIGITQRVVDNPSYPERRDALAHDWAKFIHAVDIYPVLLPNYTPLAKKMIAENSINGFLLTGGDDLQDYGGTTPERDDLEHYILEYSKKKNCSVLGICRGMQVMHVFEGGDLVALQGHVKAEHHIKFMGVSRQINSYHNHGINQLLPRFKAQAFAEDGTIEAFSHLDYKWLGVMWHPERLEPHHPQDIDFIKRFFLS
ncbi:MAG: gamma-glutamyl-gamma-aminobutyrate hydrolase family protein [Alphaproteobacteria bacterium]|nr:gamma-glutamyl-gamma-aminobutyrate hydrolase family protein [Alphaproteobacteria bacterium]